MFPTKTDVEVVELMMYYHFVNKRLLETNAKMQARFPGFHNFSVPDRDGPYLIDIYFNNVCVVTQCLCFVLAH